MACLRALEKKKKLVQVQYQHGTDSRNSSANDYNTKTGLVLCENAEKNRVWPSYTNSDFDGSHGANTGKWCTRPLRGGRTQKCIMGVGARAVSRFALVRERTRRKRKRIGAREEERYTNICTTCPGTSDWSSLSPHSSSPNLSLAFQFYPLSHGVHLPPLCLERRSLRGKKKK